ncbi:hypothetical protein EYC84_001484 [Monilinia fructicola]|uniref:Uncharacterized protein n=1 Tax=Monilinia fructicola TaxID=38448 RepID=A0A5M9JPR6_MONFR|nr:hypothetical protein EYC84_001484 [Monilinia fructicola]
MPEFNAFKDDEVKESELHNHFDGHHDAESNTQLPNEEVKDAQDASNTTTPPQPPESSTHNLHTPSEKFIAFTNIWDERAIAPFTYTTSKEKNDIMDWTYTRNS